VYPSLRLVGRHIQGNVPLPKAGWEAYTGVYSPPKAGWEAYTRVNTSKTGSREPLDPFHCWSVIRAQGP